MEARRQDQLYQELEQHLDQARDLAQRLANLEVTSGSGQQNSAFSEALRRASQYEARFIKAQREIERLRDRGEASLRDLQRLAFQDPVTGLANANLLQQHLESLAVRRSDNRQLLLLICDLDRFQVVNEVLGHDAGDTLLKRVAERLSQLVGESDALARRGEDEFVLVVPGIPMQESRPRALRLASRIKEVLSPPFLVDGQKIELTASIGASHFPELAEDASTLLSQADLALGQAKHEGRNNYRLYSPGERRRINSEMALEFQMKTALESGEFFLEYLPVIWMEETKGKLLGRVVGAEALIRWRHRMEGVLAPSRFLPLAERNGMILPIGRWVMDQVCSQLGRWSAANVNIFASVNLSGRQLLQADLVEELSERLNHYRIPPGHLSFDIDENFRNFDQGIIDETFVKLSQSGFSLTLDNFGRGLSSLERLCHARFLKLALPLVQEGGPALTKGINLATALGLVAVAVGVEEVSTAEALHQAGCNLAQGHLFSESLDAERLTELYRQGPFMLH